MKIVQENVWTILFNTGVRLALLYLYLYQLTIHIAEVYMCVYIYTHTHVKIYVNTYIGIYKKYACVYIYINTLNTEKIFHLVCNFKFSFWPKLVNLSPKLQAIILLKVRARCLLQTTWAWIFYRCLGWSDTQLWIWSSNRRTESYTLGL